jgi:hypothetical protein
MRIWREGGMAGGLGELRESVLASGSRFLAMVGESAHGPHVSQLRRHLAGLATPEYRVVVCDGWRDKSAFLNAFAGRPGVFPSRAAAGAYAVTLKWSEQEYALAHFAQEDPVAAPAAPAPVPVPLDSVPELVATQALGGSAGEKVLYLLELGAPVPLLESGLVLIDVPGAREANLRPACIAVTSAFMPNADAMLFIVSPDERLSGSELAFLRRALEQMPSVIIAVTLAREATPANKNEVESLREISARITALSPGDLSRLAVVPVVLPAGQHAGERGSEYPAAPGIAELRARLLDGLAEKNSAQLAAALDAMRNALEAQRAALAPEIAMARADRTAIEENLRLRQEEQAHFEAEAQGRLSRLGRDISRAGQRVVAKLDRDLKKLGDQFLRTLGPRGEPDSAEQISGLLAGADRATEEAAEMLAGDLAALADEYGAAPHLFHPQFPPAGAAAGTMILPGVGTILGAAIGWRAGFSRPSGRLARLLEGAAGATGDTDGSEQRARVQAGLDNVRQQVVTDFAEGIQDLRQAVLSGLDREIRESRGALNKSTILLRDAGQDRENSAAAREQDLSAFAELTAQVDALRDRVGSSPRSSSGHGSGDLHHEDIPGQADVTAADRGEPETGPYPVDPGPERYLVGEFPGRVRAGAEFSLIVSVISGTPGQGVSAAPMPALTVGPAGIPVTFLIFPEAELAVLGESQQTVLVPQHGDSVPARFVFRAPAVGLSRVLVRAFLGGTFLAALLVEVSVESDAPAADSQRRGTPLGTLDADPGEVTLQVHFDGAQYSFQLLSQKCLYGPVLAKSLTENPGHAVERTVAMLRKMATNSSGYPPQLAARWVRETGAGLWRDLVPQTVQDQFWQLKDSITAFTIACDRDVVPWELLYPVAPGTDAGFLVEQFPVLRRVYGQSRSHRLWLGNAHYVIPPRPPANAHDEIAAIRRILGQPADSPIEHLAALLELLDAGLAGMLHFTCHSSFSAEDGGSSIVMADGRFYPELLNSMAASHRLAGHSPLVFINACQSARAAAHWTQMMSWASQFMAAGAGAFIGTLWPVRSSQASRFAEAFYTSLAAGADLGHAALAARQTAKDDGDPTWLAYTVYGDPAASRFANT